MANARCARRWVIKLIVVSSLAFSVTPVAAVDFGAFAKGLSQGLDNARRFRGARTAAPNTGALATTNNTIGGPMRGGGTASCGAWTQETKTSESLLIWDLREWVLGYVTAYNVIIRNGEDIATGIDNPGLLGWIDNYCAAHPTDPVADAAWRLLDYLTTQRAQPSN